MKALSTAVIVAVLALSTPAGAGPVCRLFDARLDFNCPYEPDDIAKRINYFCGENSRKQLRHGSGDCRHDGFASNLKQFTLRGAPAVKWKVKGRKSHVTLATGCYCMIDE